jgi:putative transposase
MKPPPREHLTQEWFTPAEIAAMALPMLPDTERGVRALADRWRVPANEYPRNPRGSWRVREGRGGGYEYHYALFPSPAQAQLVYQVAKRPAQVAEEAARADLARASAWEAYDRAPQRKREEAQRRLDVIQSIEALQAGNVPRDRAIMLVAAKVDVSIRTVYNWLDLIAGRPVADRLAYLIPHHAGRATRTEISTEVWEAYYGLYMRPERPSHAHCYRDLQRIGRERGWTIPALKTLQRRIDEVPLAVQTLERGGRDALKRMVPAQSRDKTALHAMEIVNADGHRWDVMVEWEDGKIGRPHMVAFQDVHSGVILSYRIDRSENRHTTRLAIGDMIETHGIPGHVIFDNGRNFAAKWITGGTSDRFRFKVKDSDPIGILPQLGVQVHFTTPYHGQAKPIERAFRDLANTVAKDPRLAGAYVGKSPVDKPSNYGDRVIPIAKFLDVVADGIAEHNARPGRQGQVARGRSFLQVYEDSLAQAGTLIRRATAAQRALWLLVSEPRTVTRPDAHIEIGGNRYWSEALIDHMGDRVLLRFDPDALHEPVQVCRLDGSYLCDAPCVERGGFLDIAAAERQARLKKQFIRAVRERAEAERGLSIDAIADMLPATEPAPVPEPRVIAPVFGNAARKMAPAPQSETREDLDAAFSASVARLADYRLRGGDE